MTKKVKDLNIIRMTTNISSYFLGKMSKLHGKEIESARQDLFLIANPPYGIIRVNDVTLEASNILSNCWD